MKQSLQLRLSQQLAMTPQLQQAIRLLQLSTLELQQEIQQALESNPLLEQDDDQPDPVSDDTAHTADPSDPTTETTTENDVEELDTLDALEQKEMPDDLPLDTQWEEIYTAGTPSGTSSDYTDDELPLYQGETTASLQDYLTWQADLTPFSETDKAIAISIIDAIDETGYLTVTTDDILAGMGDDELELDEVEAVLKRIQRFDPIGVAARDLKECLLIQLSAFSTETPYLKETQLVISQYLELLGNRDFRQLMRQAKLREETLKSVIELIQSLDPKPGLSIDTGESEYVIPDILVKKSGERWQVELNTDSIPRLRINETYAALGQSTQNESDGKFIRDNLQEAKWLIKSLESRNETLLKVAHCIVDTQQAFFELGEEHMKPLVLADIAEQVEMHESTISRVTTQKFCIAQEEFSN